MEKELDSKLWVIKYCIKLLYPKFNYYVFMVFLAIKYRYNQNKYKKTMDVLHLKSRPENILKSILKEHISDNYLHILGRKCILIPKDTFIDLCIENFFYVDNGVLWVTLSLSNEEKKRHKEDNAVNNFLKINFSTCDIHKKLWSGFVDSIDNRRVVAIVGSKLIEENTAYTSESELQNILTSFGIKNTKNIQVVFHPMHLFELSPKIAASAEVNLIINEYNIDNDFHKEVLSNYFEKPRLVSVNDTISIDLTPELTCKYHYKYLDLIESSGSMVFKCTKLGSDDKNNDTQSNIIKAFYIVKGVTQLSLGENMHSLRPNIESSSLPGSGKNLSVTHLCPLGLRSKFDQMQETIEPFLSGDINELSDAMSSPILPLLLLSGPPGSGRHLIVKTLAKCNGLNCVSIDCHALQSSTAKQTESKIYAMVQKAKDAAPAIILLDNFEVFAVDPENNEDQRIVEYFINTVTDLYLNYTKHSIIFIAVTESRDLKPNIMRLFLDKFHIPKLNNQQRNEMLQWFTTIMELNIDNIDNKEINADGKLVFKDSIDNLTLHSKEVIQRVASKTETFLYGNLDTLMHFAMRESYLKQVNNYLQLPQDPNLHIIHEDDFNNALESIRTLQSQHLDTPKIQKVYWEDIGGLEKLKKELLKTIEFPIKFPHLFKNSSLKRSGILLYGPPGCGKTLVAKAVSTELNVSFMSVKGPELLNMYIGQSEENVRKVFESARASSPCIVFLDELDALCPRRGAAGDSGGASDRVVSQLLAEVDGVVADDGGYSNKFI